MQRLDPKLDVTFKLLLTRHPELLRNMLEAVLDRAIAELEVLNPAVPGELIGDKSIELDVRVRLADGTRVDVEMQVRVVHALADRLLYYAARDYAGQLARGGGYDELTPTVLVVWMVAPLFPDLEQYHSIFELRERRAQRLFSPQLAIHLLQLGFIAVSAAAADARDEALRRWGRFLLAESDGELDALGEEDLIMSAARTALDELSQDPEAARLARERSDALKLHEIDLAHAKRQGKSEGEIEGKATGKIEGKIEGKIDALLAVLAARGVAVSEDAKTRIAAEKDPALLERWLTRAVTVASVTDLFLA